MFGPLRALMEVGNGPSFLQDPRTALSQPAPQAPANVARLRAQADAADRTQLQRVQRNERAETAQFGADQLAPRGISGVFRENREIGNQIQQQSNPEFDQWRLYNQNLKNMGVRGLATDTSQGVKRGGTGVDRRQVVDYQSQLRGGPQITGYEQGPNLAGGREKGFFDQGPQWQHSLANTFANPMGRAMATTAPEGVMYNPDNTYENNALRQLRKWSYR